MGGGKHWKATERGVGENVKLKSYTDKSKLKKFGTLKACVWIPKPYYTEEVFNCQNKKNDTSSWEILKAGPKRQHGHHSSLNSPRTV